MSTLVDIDLTIIEHLDFDHTPPCELVDGDCDREAKWTFTHGSSCVTLKCQEHKVGIQAFIRDYENLCITCTLCGGKVTSVNMKFTPIS